MNRTIEKIHSVPDRKDPKSFNETKIDLLVTNKAIEAQRMQDVAAKQLGIDINAREKAEAAQLRSSRQAAREALGIVDVPMGPKAKKRSLADVQDRAVTRLGYKNAQEMRAAAAAEKPGRVDKALDYLLDLIGIRPEPSNDTQKEDRMTS